MCVLVYFPQYMLTLHRFRQETPCYGRQWDSIVFHRQTSHTHVHTELKGSLCSQSEVQIKPSKVLLVYPKVHILITIAPIWSYKYTDSHKIRSGYSEMALLRWCLISGRRKDGKVHPKNCPQLQETAGQSICDWFLLNTIMHTHARHLSIRHGLKKGATSSHMKD